MDIFIAENYKGLFKVIISLLRFKEKDLLNGNFEDNLELLGKLVESELFRNTNFDQYMNLRKKQLSQEEIKKIVSFYEDYEFVFHFKSTCK